MPHPAEPGLLRGNLASLADAGFDTLVSLLTSAEAEELKLGAERDLAAELGMEFLSFPVPDMQVPDDLAAFAELASDIARRVQNDHRVAVHCWGGIGRSGLLAAAVLVLLGHRSQDVFDQVSRARGESVPETREQAEWFADQLLPWLAATNR